MSEDAGLDVPEVTRLLGRLAGGDAGAGNLLFARLQGELRAVAERQLARQGAGHTLQPTALVNEAWLKVFGGADAAVEGRSHLFSLMAKAMRSVLVDHARARIAEKRGGAARPLSLDATGVVSTADGGLALLPADLLAVDETLERLRGQDPELAEVVELRFWAGLSNEDIAAALRVHVHTVERRFQVARAWMQRELSRAGQD